MAHLFDFIAKGREDSTALPTGSHTPSKSSNLELCLVPVLVGLKFVDFAFQFVYLS